MNLRELFIVVLLMVSICGLSISPNEMKVIEFQPKKSFFEKKKAAFLASVSAISIPSFGQSFQLARQIWPIDRPVLPLPSTVSR